MEDNVRNATVIADQEVHLLVIPKSLFNDTIKAHQEQELRDCHEFVESHPLFKDWPKKYKQLLEISLVREYLSLDQPIVRQGQPFDGLVFIRSGRAKVLTEPRRYSAQYPSMAPFTASHDILEIEGLRKNKKLRTLKPLRMSTDDVKQHHVALRRKEGYASVERDMQSRTILLCNVQPGEIVGDAEYLLELGSYVHTVTCTTYTEVYRFTVQNMERLMSKVTPRTLNVLRLGVELKLLSRMNTPQGKQIQLLKFLLFKLTDKTKPEERSPEVRAVLSKFLPDKEVLFQQLIRAYMNDRAALLSPYVPGGVFYKEKMRDRNRNLDAIISNRPLRGRDNGQRARKSIRQYQADLFRELEEFKLYEKERLRKRIKERKAENIAKRKHNEVSITAAPVDDAKNEREDPVEPFFVTDLGKSLDSALKPEPNEMATKSDSSLKLPPVSEDNSFVSINRPPPAAKPPVVQQDYKIWHFGVRGYTMLEEKLKMFYSSDDCLPGHRIK